MPTPAVARIGTWNLDRSAPRWRHSPQFTHVQEEADLWLLTEIPADFGDKKDYIVFSALRPDDPGQHWSAIWSKWPLKRIPAVHTSLAMARVEHSDGVFLAAASVFPWRGAATFWPTGDGDTFAQRCARTLAKHTAEIEKTSGGLPVLWGGDFNQALSGRDYVGTDVGQDALFKAFKELGLRALTVNAAGQDRLHRAIDHIAFPTMWNSGDVEVHRPQSDTRFLSDHPSYVVSVQRAAVGSAVRSVPEVSSAT